MIQRRVQVNNRTVQVQQDLQFGHAGSVWDGALVLIHYLNHNSKKYQQLFAGKSIIELGAGTGILGLSVGCFNPKMVVMTDFKENILLIEKNIKINHPNKSEIFSSQQLSWGDKQSMESLRERCAPQFIIGSELAYDHNNIQLLLRTIDYFQNYNQDLVSIISYQKYQKESVNLAKQLKENGYKFKQVPWIEMDPEFRDSFIGILVIEGKS